MKYLLSLLLGVLLLGTAAACSSGSGNTPDFSAAATQGGTSSAVSAGEESLTEESSPSVPAEPLVEETLTTLSLPYSETRNVTVRVFVPAHQENETLPVIYMPDGQNLFESEITRFGSWNVHKAVRAEQELTGRAAIIVGIHNDGSAEERTNDLTPLSIGALDVPAEDEMTEIEKQQMALFQPAGEVFDAFVVNTVMPAVEEQFPVKKGREHTAFCGSSSGGLQAFYTTMTHPDRFSYGGMFSPALMYYIRDDLDQWTRDKAAQAKDKPFLFWYVGGGDQQERLLTDYVDHTCEVLLDCYPAERIKKVQDEDQPHHESAWGEYFADFLHLFLESSVQAGDTASRS